MRERRLLHRLSQGALHNVRFAEMTGLIESFGFVLARVNGSHHIFRHREISELVNLQDVRGEAKPYQIRQFLRLVERYDLRMQGMEDEA